MSISPQVRETGRMEDEYGIRIVFGVDHGSVTVNNVQFLAADGEFTRHLFAAIEAAKAQDGVPCTGACCIGADDNAEGSKPVTEVSKYPDDPKWVEKLSIVCSRGEDVLCAWPLCSCPCHEGLEPHAHLTDLAADTCPICFPAASADTTEGE